MDKSGRMKNLEGQIVSLQHQIHMAENWSDSVHSLESFTIEDKVRIFDELYTQATDYLRTFVETGWPPKDGCHYLYEAVMTHMLGKDVWPIIRMLQR